MKRKFITLMLAGITAISFSACGEKTQTSEAPAAESTEAVQTEEAVTEAAPEETPAVEETIAPQAETAASGTSDILVVYFSYGENAELPEGVDASSSASIQTWNGELTGNTGAVAHMISEAAGADLFSIQTAEKYPDSYDATISKGQEERNANARPELANHIENLDDYSTIILGYPNWWSDMPMAVYSFLDEYDLSGKTVIPFVTSGGSGFSGTVSAIQDAEPSADVQQGLALSDSGSMEAQAEIENWLNGLGYMQ